MSVTGSTSPTPPPGARPRSRRRTWAFRLVAVVGVPAVLLLVLEGGLRLVGFGQRTTFFVTGTVDGREVLLANHEFGLRFFPPGLAREPVPLAVPADKRDFAACGSAGQLLPGASFPPPPAGGLFRRIETK